MLIFLVLRDTSRYYRGVTITFDDEKEERKLTDLKKQEEEDLVQVLAASKYNLPYVNLLTQTIENEALRLIPEESARAFEIAPFKLVGKTAHVAVRSPSRDEVVEFEKSLEEKGYTVIAYMASQQSLEKAWERYKELSFASESKAGSLDISGETLEALGSEIHTMLDIPRIIEKSEQEHKTHKISHLLEIILAGAISINASDIHIEPEESRMRVRFRLDGVLQDVLFLKLDVFQMINSRIKLLSGLKLTIKNKAQDGRFSIMFKEIEINIRTSLIPGA